MRFIGQDVELLRKRIRRMHLYVLPPDGRLRVTAPLRQPERDILAFLSEKRAWIARKQAEVRQRAVRAGEVGFGARPYLGALYPVRYAARQDRRGGVAVALDGAAFVVTAPRAMAEAWARAAARDAESSGDAAGEMAGGGVLNGGASLDGMSDGVSDGVLNPRTPPDCASTDGVPPDPAPLDRAFDAFYRAALLDAVPDLLARWSRRAGQTVAGWQPRRMRSRWGSMNVRARRMTLNTALMKKPPECLEYVIVHELCHLLVPNHSAAFYGALTPLLPDWRERRARLNDMGAP